MVKIFLKIFFVAFVFSAFAHASNAQTASPIKILLVPGHDNEVWGAQYGNLKESAMNLAVATRIYNILKNDKRFEVHITRDVNGYTKEFADYFAEHQTDIVAFKENAKKERKNQIATGSFVESENNPHLNASEDVAIKLYGFNKWADENNIDAMIHVHFNDYPRAKSWTAGKYKGFVIYFPEGQMVNWKESSQLAANIFTQLHPKYLTSTYEKELGGLIPDQNLIALGSNGTLNATVRSILIEYGYIYRFGGYDMRHKAYDDFAQRTATGIEKYFFP